MERILVIRLSAMGDVAMTVPVINRLLAKYPAVEINILTRPAFRAIFPRHERIQFIDLDLNDKHKGFLGLLRLFKSLRKNNYSAVADLHDVLRSQVIRTLFRLNGTKVSSIDKGRGKKTKLTRKKNKHLTQLKTSHERYADVFHKLGYSIDLSSKVLKITSINKIGIAPFAAHEEKMWPIEKTKQLIAQFLEKTNAEIYLFGGGKEESKIINTISEASHRIISTADSSLEEQLEIMARLSMMISMDSANMHLASNANIPVISIWGATHPFAGFLGFNQPVSNCVQRDELACRPCSVFGNKTCWRGDWACMDIEVNDVFERCIHGISSIGK